MQKYDRTKHRNNGKSKYHYVATKSNIITTDNDDQKKFHNRDLGLFNMARTLNVKINRRQRIRWFFNINDCFDDVSLRQKIENICSRYGFVGKRTIVLKKDNRVKRLMIDTPLFLFTVDNIVLFSNDLLQLARGNSIFYERWEVVPSKTTLLTKITRLFN